MRIRTQHPNTKQIKEIIKCKVQGAYSGLGYHHPKHQAFASSQCILVFSNTREQIHVHSSQKPAPNHTVKIERKFSSTDKVCQLMKKKNSKLKHQQIT